MSRKDGLTEEEDTKLQEPVMEALEQYFDATYTVDSRFGTLGTICGSDKAGCILVYSALRVPVELLPAMEMYFMAQRALLERVLGVPTSDSVDKEH